MQTTIAIAEFIDSQPEPKRSEMQLLHQRILEVMPGCRLWFLDGRDGTGKVVSNPNIGYGNYTIAYADGSKKDFYQIGLSANTTGISVYIMGLKDKAFLAQTYGDKLGKASVTGYCIKFKTLNAIHQDVLMDAIQQSVRMTNVN